MTQKEGESELRTEPLIAHLKARYGGGSAPKDAKLPFNPVLDTILNHRSIRHYSDKPLPSGLVEILVAAAQSASSSSNLQAFSIVAVEDPHRKQRLSKLAAGQKHVAEAPLVLMFIADLARLKSVAGLHGETADGLDYLESFLVALTDAAFAAQNVFVALESLGLGACYIGAMRNHPQEVAQEIALPPSAFVVFGMTIGYPAASVKTSVKPRLPQSTILHREQYQEASPSEIASYDSLLHEFRTDQQMSDAKWSRQATDRVRRAESLMGRHVLYDVLQSLGFKLK